MKRLIIVLTVFMFLFPFQQIANAETPQIIADYREFDSFMKRYNEHSSELAYFIGTSYDSNDHYFRENFQLFRDTINQFYDTDKNSFISSYLDSSEELFSKPIALLGVSNDLRKALFDKIKSVFVKPKYEFSNIPNTGSTTLYMPKNYFIKYYQDVYDNNYDHINFSYANGLYNFEFKNATTAATPGSARFSSYTSDSIQYAVLLEWSTKLQQKNISWADFYKTWYTLNAHLPLTIVYDDGNKQEQFLADTSEPVQQITNVYNRIVNDFDKDARFNQDYTPTVQPQLVCPSGTIALNFDNGQFKTTQNEIVLLNADETTIHNGSLCNLDFKFPEIYYHEDTGKIIVGGQDLTEIPSDSPQGFDNSLIEYVRNSYNYATTIINSGVNGLKSIVAGTTGLLSLVGSVFSFLPSEMLTLLIGGFSIALGLWVFKK